MNNKLLVLVSIAALGTSSLASAAGGGMMPGIKGGLTVTKTNDTPSTGASFGMGYAAGASVNFEVSPMASVMVDVLFAQRSTKYTGDITVKTKGIEVPVLLTFKVSSLLIEAGGYFAYGIGDIDYGGTALSYSAAGFKKTDFGLTGGLGFMVPTGKMSFLLEARYNFGLANTAEAAGVTSKRMSIDVLAGLYF